MSTTSEDFVHAAFELAPEAKILLRGTDLANPHYNEAARRLFHLTESTENPLEGCFEHDSVKSLSSVLQAEGGSCWLPVATHREFGSLNFWAHLSRLCTSQGTSQGTSHGASTEPGHACWNLTLYPKESLPPALVAERERKTESPVALAGGLVAALCREMARHLTDRLQALHLAAERSSPQSDQPCTVSVELWNNVRRSLEAGESLLTLVTVLTDEGSRGGARKPTANQGETTKQGFNLAAQLRRLGPLFQQMARSCGGFQFEIDVGRAMVPGSEAELLTLICALVHQKCQAPRTRAQNQLRLRLRMQRNSVDFELRERWPVGTVTGVSDDVLEEPNVYTKTIERIVESRPGIRLECDPPALATHGGDMLERRTVLRLPRLSSAKDPKQRPGTLPAAGAPSQREIVFSGADRAARHVLTVAAQRLGARVINAVAGREGPALAWIIDLSACDYEALEPRLKEMGEGPARPLDQPLIFLSPRRRPDAEIDDRGQLLSILRQRGAMFVQSPLSIDRALHLLDGLSLRESDAPWYRIHVAS